MITLIPHKSFLLACEMIMGYYIALFIVETDLFSIIARAFEYAAKLEKIRRKARERKRARNKLAETPTAASISAKSRADLDLERELDEIYEKYYKKK